MIQQAIREYVEYVVQVYGVVCLFYKPAWPNDIFVENLNTTYDDKILFDVLRKSFLYFPENQIRKAIIGEGEKDKIADRLDTAKFLLDTELSNAMEGIPHVDKDFFVKEKNPELYDALTAFKDKEWAFTVMHRLNRLLEFAESKENNILNTFNKIEGFVKGKNTAEATTPETSPETSPDFSHTNSFTPTIEFDMSALYSFLIKEEVISGVDEALFSNCISHAHVNELWGNGVISKLKLVIHHLQQNHYPQEWFDEICNNLGMTRKDMGKFNVPKRKEFEQKMTMLK